VNDLTKNRAKITMQDLYLQAQGPFGSINLKGQFALLLLLLFILFIYFFRVKQTYLSARRLAALAM
jgi:hypothetical protein